MQNGTDSNNETSLGGGVDELPSLPWSEDHLQYPWNYKPCTHDKDCHQEFTGCSPKSARGGTEMGCTCYGYLGYDNDGVNATKGIGELQCKMNRECQVTYLIIYIPSLIFSIHLFKRLFNCLRIGHAAKKLNWKSVKSDAAVQILSCLFCGSIAWMVLCFSYLLPGGLGLDTYFAMEKYVHHWLVAFMSLFGIIGVINVAGLWIELSAAAAKLRKKKAKSMGRIGKQIKIFSAFFTVLFSTLMGINRPQEASMLLLALVFVVSILINPPFIRIPQICTRSPLSYDSVDRFCAIFVFSIGSRRLGKMISALQKLRSVSSKAVSKDQTMLARLVQSIIRCANFVAFGFIFQLLGIVIYLAFPAETKRECEPLVTIGGSLHFIAPLVCIHGCEIFIRGTTVQAWRKIQRRKVRPQGRKNNSGNDSSVSSFAASESTAVSNAANSNVDSTAQSGKTNSDASSIGTCGGTTRGSDSGSMVTASSKMTSTSRHESSKVSSVDSSSNSSK